MAGSARQRSPGSIRSRLVLWVVGSTAGTLVVALPDDDSRVLSLSRTHGPSAIDLLGVGLLILAWLPIVALLWTSRGAVRGRLAVAGSLLGLTGLVLLVVSIVGDTGKEWLLGATLLLAAQLLALAAIARGRT